MSVENVVISAIVATMVGMIFAYSERFRPHSTQNALELENARLKKDNENLLSERKKRDEEWATAQNTWWRELARMQGELDGLRSIVAEKSALIDDQAELIQGLQMKVDLYEMQSKQARKPSAAAPRARVTRKLSGDQRTALRVELLGAFSTLATFDGLLQDIDHPREEITVGKSLEAIARDVIVQAESEGWLELLMVKAQEQRPNVKSLDELVNTLLGVMGVNK